VGKKWVLLEQLAVCADHATQISLDKKLTMYSKGLVVIEQCYK